MLPDYLLKKTDGTLEIVTGDVPFNVTPMGGAGTYDVYALENSAQVTVEAESTGQESGNSQRLPRLIGAQRMGSTILVDTADLTGPYSYQWYADGAEIIGADQDSYTPPAHMQQISCAVSSTEGTFQTPAVFIYHNHAMASHNVADDQVLALIPHAEASHIATADGDWSDPAIWDVGAVPGPGAVVLIPFGRVVHYDVAASPRLDRVRVDGELSWRHDLTTDMLVETLFASLSGRIIIGTRDQRIASDVQAVIRWSDRDYLTSPDAPSPIDMVRDPALLGRGLLHHGLLSVWGAKVLEWSLTSSAPMAGATELTLQKTPEGWKVGDTLVIGGTYNRVVDGVPNDENEERVITSITGNTVSWDVGEPLLYDHDHRNAAIVTEEYQPGVALKNRNVILISEAPHESQPWLRGHHMAMHGRAGVDLWHAAFLDMGRTDKSRPSGVLREGQFAFYDYAPRATSGFDTMPDTLAPFPEMNLQSRYPVHMHFTGYGRSEDRPIIVGCYVQDAPAWGFVHHGSDADFFDNVCYRFVGAGMVSETSDEVGAWVGNFIFGVRRGFNNDVAIQGNPKINEGKRAERGDFGTIGLGMFMRGRAMRVNRNLVMSCTTAYTFFHRGQNAPTSIAPRIEPLRSNLDVNALSALYATGTADDTINASDYPIIHFADNVSMGCHTGFAVTKGSGIQHHDLSVNIKRFTASACANGILLEYVATYIVTDANVASIDRTGTVGYPVSSWGIGALAQVPQIVIINPLTRQFDRGVIASTGTNKTENPDDWDAVNNPSLTLINQTNEGTGVPYEFTKGNDGTTKQPLEVMRVENTALVRPEQPYLEGGHILYDWDGNGSTQGQISNKVLLRKVDSLIVDDQGWDAASQSVTDSSLTATLPKRWDYAGTQDGNPRTSTGGFNDGATGLYLGQIANRDGLYTLDGEPVVTWPLIFSDRAFATPAFKDVCARVIDRVGNYPSAGTITYAQTKPVQPDKQIVVQKNTPIVVDIMAGAQPGATEPGAPLELFQFLDLPIQRYKPDNGDLTVDAATGSITYIPDANFVGYDECFMFIKYADRLGDYETVRIEFDVQDA